MVWMLGSCALFALALWFIFYFSQTARYLFLLLGFISLGAGVAVGTLLANQQWGDVREWINANPGTILLPIVTGACLMWFFVAMQNSQRNKGR